MDPPEDPKFVFYREPQRAGRDDRGRRRGAAGGAKRPRPLDQRGRARRRAVARARRRRSSSAAAGARHTILDLDYRPSFWASRGRGAARDRRAVVQRHGRGRQPRGVRDRGRHGGSRLGGRALLDRAARDRRREAGGRRRPRRDRRRSPRDPAAARGGGVRTRRRRRVRRSALPRAARRAQAPFEAVELANAAGAIVASRLLCADAMPTEPEVRELLEASGARS